MLKRMTIREAAKRIEAVCKRVYAGRSKEEEIQFWCNYRERQDGSFAFCLIGLFLLGFFFGYMSRGSENGPRPGKAAEKLVSQQR